MRVVVVVEEIPIPDVGQADDCEVEVEELRLQGLKVGRVFLVDSPYRGAFFSNISRILVESHPHGDEHHGQANESRDV